MQLFKQIISTTTLRVLGACLLFLMHVYFSRTFGSDAYGVLSYSLAGSAFLVLFATHGWPSGLVRLISVYNKKKQWGLFKGVLISSLGYSILLSLLISSLIILLINLELFNKELSRGLYYISLLLPVIAVSSIRKRLFQALKKPLGSVIPDEIVLPIIVCAAIFYLSIEPGDSIYLYLFALIANLIFALAWLWLIIPSEVKSARHEYATKNWLVVILPMMFGGVGQILLNRTDVIMIGSLLPIENAGIYSAALRISLLTTFILGSINILITPKLASSFHTEDKKKFDYYRRQSIFFSGLGGLPVFLAIIIWPSELMSLFGSEYEAYGVILVVLAIGQLINALTGASGFILLMSGQERYYAKSLLIAAVFNLCANYIAIIYWQILGAAVVTAFTIAILNIFQFSRAMSVSIKSA